MVRHLVVTQVMSVRFTPDPPFFQETGWPSQVRHVAVILSTETTQSQVRNILKKCEMPAPVAFLLLVSFIIWHFFIWFS